jgi:hypothetical protein
MPDVAVSLKIGRQLMSARHRHTDGGVNAEYLLMAGMRTKGWSKERNTPFVVVSTLHKVFC